MARRATQFTLSQMFGLGKGIGLTPEETKQMAYGQIGKSSLKDFTQRELNDVCYELIIRKDKSGSRSSRASDQQLHKIAEYEQLLGWAANPQRLQAFTEKFYGISSVRWMTSAQASKLIESLKKMYQRERKKG